MKNLKRLGTAVVLTFVLGLSTFAGETHTGPCAPAEPGETDTPPCVAASGDMYTPTTSSPTPGEMDTPGLTEIAVGVLESILPLF